MLEQNLNQKKIMKPTTSLKSFVLKKNFPCIMAKKVFMRGNLHYIQVSGQRSANQIAETIYDEAHNFLKIFKEKPKKASSFIVEFNHSNMSFLAFETYFWKILKEVRRLEMENDCYDKRVSSDPQNKDFSFSIASEAFFIILLHPDSPRKARRFSNPTIVFNPHIQFENLRKNKLFQTVKKLIRKRDRALQGSVNPMLQDYGVNSEVLQYSGRIIENKNFNPFN